MSDAMLMIIVVVGGACTCANYLWQILHAHAWDKAFERSYFQVVALGCVILTARAKGLM